VSISGDYAIVGASNESEDVDGNNTLLAAGSAYIFAKDQGGTDNWGLVKKIISSDRDANDNFGRSVSISNGYAIVGAYLEDHDTEGNNELDKAGSAYLFGRDQGGTDNWGEVNKITASDGVSGDRFGQSVSISGDHAIVGAYFEDHDVDGNNALSESGSAYIYYRHRGGVDNWGQINKIVASDRGGSDQFGFATAISGEYVLVGSYTEDEDENGNNTLSSAGSAYFFNKQSPPIWNGSTWTPATPTATDNAVIAGSYDAASDGDISSAYLIISAGETVTVGSGSIDVNDDLEIEGTLTMTNGNLNTSGNWQNDGTSTQQVSGNSRFFNLTVNNSNGVTISDNDTIWIGRLLDMQDGDLVTSSTDGAILVLDAIAARTAEVVNGTGAVTGDGAIVRQFIQGNHNGAAYRHLASSVSGQQFSQLSGPDFSVDLSKADDYNTMGAGIGSTNFPNVFTYRSDSAETAFSDGWFAPSASDNITAGLGFTVNMDRSDNHGATPLAFKGTLNNGDFDVDVSNPAASPSSNNLGYALLGNPYPSPLDAQQFIDHAANDAALDGTIYIFRSQSQYGGSYASRTKAGVKSNPSAFDDYIAPAQAFFVRSKVANGTVEFRNTMRPTAFQGPSHQRTEGNPAGYHGLLRLEAAPVADPGKTSNAVLLLHPEATRGEDVGHEAAMLVYQPSGYPTILTQQNVGGEQGNMQINALPSAVKAGEVITEPLMFWTYGKGQYTITASEINHFAAGAEVYLEDRETSTMHDLTANPIYTFEVTADNYWSGDRFLIHFHKTYQAPQVTGLEDLEAAGIKVSGYDGMVTVFFTEADPSAKVEVLDMTGRRTGQASHTDKVSKTLEVAVPGHKAVIVRITGKDGTHAAKLLMNN
jgi:hypothetical protein